MTTFEVYTPFFFQWHSISAPFMRNDKNLQLCIGKTQIKKTKIKMIYNHMAVMKAFRKKMLSFI